MRYAGTSRIFHKILKSGCRVEESRLRTAPRWVNLIAKCRVLARRIFRLTMIHRSQPTVALSQLELQLQWRPIKSS